MGLQRSLLIILVGAAITLAAANNDTRICQVAPHWEIGNQSPMEQLSGQLVVVALLKASWQFCLTQAAKLGILRDKLSLQGLKNIHYIIVNEKTLESRAMYWKLKLKTPKNITVYQQSAFRPDVWRILRGNKDDFLIYDRCGKLTFHITSPYSYLNFRYVEAAIMATYNTDYCGNCMGSSTTLEATSYISTGPNWEYSQHHSRSLK